MWCTHSQCAHAAVNVLFINLSKMNKICVWNGRLYLTCIQYSLFDWMLPAVPKLPSFDLILWTFLFTEHQHDDALHRSSGHGGAGEGEKGKQTIWSWIGESNCNGNCTMRSHTTNTRVPYKNGGEGGLFYRYFAIVCTQAQIANNEQMSECRYGAASASEGARAKAHNGIRWAHYHWTFYMTAN